MQPLGDNLNIVMQIWVWGSVAYFHWSEIRYSVSGPKLSTDEESDNFTFSA